ncbi:MAG: DUF2283 domain-containing protein [Candidatus Aenigmarchaeota archaeon]|nr:DUF2283 domain-containing protein [Candidatus Aenigmarchaeota archaeon]
MDKKYYYDEKSDSLFIHLKDGEEESFEEIAPGINIELDENNEIIGIEILHASRFTMAEKRAISAMKH